MKPSSESNLSDSWHESHTVIHRYRNFLLKYRGALRLLEDSLSKLVLYAPSRFVIADEDDINEESSSYKILPETLYAIIHVWSLLNDTLYYGFGKGTGLSIGHIEEFNSCKQSHACKNVLIMLRSTLSILECIYPALEVSTYYASNKSTRGIKHHNSRSLGIQSLQVAKNVEMIKCLCRFGILLINYLMQYNVCIGTADMIKGLGILESGASLEPEIEQHINYINSSEDEKIRIKKMLYTGQRTGRKSQMIDPIAVIRSKSNHIQGVSIFDAPLVKLVMLIIGEMLHVYRPLYYINSRLKQEHKSHLNSNSVDEIRLWVLSLCMDVVSYKLIKESKAVILSNRDGDASRLDTLSKSSKEELYRRKLRWTLYLLRPPVWESLISSCFMRISWILKHIPFFGEPLVNYCLDMILYCKKWHFMMEK